MNIVPKMVSIPSWVSVLVPVEVCDQSSCGGRHHDRITRGHQGEPLVLGAVTQAGKS